MKEQQLFTAYSQPNTPEPRQFFLEELKKLETGNGADINFDQLFKVYQEHNDKLLSQYGNDNKDELTQEKDLEKALYQNLFSVFNKQQESKKFDQEQLQKDPIIQGILKFFTQALNNYLENIKNNKITQEIFLADCENYWQLSRKALMLFARHNNLITSQKEKEALSQILLKQIILLGQPDEKSTDFKYLIITLTDLIGAEAVRSKLNNKIADKKSKNISTDNFEYARSLITPNHDKIAIENLQNFYQDHNFKGYELNRIMAPIEVELLKDLIPDNHNVLEQGFGADGRLFLKMKKSGYNITGFDFTQKHVEATRELDPDAKILQADWHQTGFKDGSFDTVYSLGRNILHDYSIVDQAQLFREAARILKPGGKFIFDTPTQDKGDYKLLIETYKKEMEKRGIKNFRYGTIYDSPDKEHYMTRYTFSEDDIKMLADLAGFKIVEVRKEELPTGEGDENLYYVLEKISASIAPIKKA